VAWLTFAALTILLCFGATDTVSLGGLDLTAKVAAAVAFALSCAYYYRAVLSMAVLQVWREALRERRRLRFGTLLQLAKGQGQEVEKETLRDINGFVAEYPGYLACSVLVKDEAQKRGGVSGTLVPIVHKGIILMFSIAPYLLAGALSHRSQYSITFLAIAFLGIAVCLTANIIVRLGDRA
jgi:hypothetical protein